MAETVRGRFAPSPSGRLHLGNIMSCLLAWCDARSKGGKMVFRLEDLDPERSWDSYARLMADDLRWLGLDWDEGWPEDGAYAQSERSALYGDALKLLAERGLIYPCFCSRAQRLAASAPHPGEESLSAGCRCRNMSDGEKAALIRAGRRPAAKVAVPDVAVSVHDGHFGDASALLRPGADDFIVRRSDGVFAYQLAVSVDDAAMGITRVVRARDLLGSAPRQKWLIGLLGGTAPEYCHCPLLVAPGGRKLSKRDGDLNMDSLREKYSPEELTGRLAHMCGLIDRPEPISARELVPIFDWARVPVHDIELPDDF